MQRSEEIAKIWLNKALDDVNWAEDSLEDGHFSGVCFLSQQIVEKVLKAYLYFKRERLIRVHDLFKLLRRCEKFDPEFKKFGSTAKNLNPYYVDTRYPDIWDISRFEDEKLATEALELAKEVVKFVEKQIKI